MPKYHEIQFIRDPQWEVAYAEMSEDETQTIRLLDENGKEIELPAKCESKVVSTDAFPIVEGKIHPKSPKWRKKQFKQEQEAEGEV